MSRKRWMNVVRVAVSVAALGFLIWRIDLQKTLDELRHADLRYLLLAFLLFVISLFIRAYRWLVLVRSLNTTVPFLRLARLYFVGQFFSTFLPTAFGGDVVRALELTQDTDASAAIGTVLLDRLSGLLVLFVMGLAALPFTVSLLEPWLIGVLIGVAGGGLLAGLLVLEGRILRRVTERLPAVLSLAGQGSLARIYAALTGCGWRAVMKAFGVSVVFNFVNIIINWLCGLTVGVGIGLGYFFAATPLLAVSLIIPSIGGWGVRELVSTALFGAESPEKAATLGVTLGLIGLAAGLIGGVVYFAEGARGMVVARREGE